MEGQINTMPNLPWIIFLLSLILLIIPSANIYGEISVAKISDTIVDTKALTIKGGYGQSINGKAFQQDVIVTHGDYQYLGYYDGKRQVCMARRKLPAGDWEIIRFKDYDFKSNDAHNTISIGICPLDGTIHMAFDHHGHPLHYRVSQKDTATKPEKVTWEPALFSSIRSELEKGKPIKITYPRFWQTPEGGLQFCYRRGGSGNGDRMLVDYDANAGTWLDTRRIDSHEGVFIDKAGRESSSTRCSYPNGYCYGPFGKLHATWVWRESAQSANHDLMYAFSEDQGKTWLNNAGEPLERPPHLNSPGITVVNIDSTYGLMNTHGQALDSKGRIHVVMWHCSDESFKETDSKPGESRWGPPQARRYQHYWRENNGDWKHTELPGVAGNRPKVFIDKNDHVFLIYRSSEQALPSGSLMIAVATPESKWTDWIIIHTEEGPFLNEMLGDRYRWKSTGILSIIAQEAPREIHQSTPLHVLDFAFEMD